MLARGARVARSALAVTERSGRTGAVASFASFALARRSPSGTLAVALRQAALREPIWRLLLVGSVDATPSRTLATARSKERDADDLDDDASSAAAGGGGGRPAGGASDGASGTEGGSSEGGEGAGKDGDDKAGDDDGAGAGGSDTPWGRVLAILGLMGLGLYFGLQTAKQLFPMVGGVSPQTVRSRAFDAVDGSEDVTKAFGRITRMFGTDYGSERGRRNFVRSYTYERRGRSYTRVKFHIENEQQRRGTIYAEVAHDRPNEFNYLFVELPNKRVLTLHDNREPEKPREVRQSEVAMRLMTVRAAFYGKGPVDTVSRAQEGQLGKYWSYVRYVRCDLNEADCEKDGITNAPAWIINGKTIEGHLRLEQLEEVLGMA